MHAAYLQFLSLRKSLHVESIKGKGRRAQFKSLLNTNHPKHQSFLQTPIDTTSGMAICFRACPRRCEHHISFRTCPCLSLNSPARSTDALAHLLHAAPSEGAGFVALAPGFLFSACTRKNVGHKTYHTTRTSGDERKDVRPGLADDTRLRLIID